MINQGKFVQLLNSLGIDFFVGVPDSHLNGFCTYLLENIEEKNNLIAANEGNAIALAAGYYFSTGKIPMVYLQNSGMGNMLNPLLSLADKDVYKVPMVLLIGWRGEPGTNDWAQHKMQGEITLPLLDLVQIPYIIAENNDELLGLQVINLVDIAKTERKPVAIVAKKNVFTTEKKGSLIPDNRFPLFREEAIEAILDIMPKDSIFVATTGRATRELYFLRERRNEGHEHDFLNVGSMGHTSSVAFTIALANPQRNVICLDGDSAALMHLGAFSMVSKVNVPNLLHVVLNNGAHESVGGQPSAGMRVDFTTIAHGCGYATIGGAICSKTEIEDSIQKLSGRMNAGFIDIHIKNGMLGKLPPLNISHEQLITDLMNELISNKEEKK